VKNNEERFMGKVCTCNSIGLGRTIKGKRPVVAYVFFGTDPNERGVEFGLNEEENIITVGNKYPPLMKTEYFNILDMYCLSVNSFSMTGPKSRIAGTILPCGSENYLHKLAS